VDGVTARILGIARTAGFVGPGSGDHVYMLARSGDERHVAALATRRPA
jgi:hypothetical protein